MDGFCLDNVSYAPINPKILVWARKRAGLTHEQLSQNFVPVEKLKSWEENEFPTLAQAETLAERLYLPLPIFFLDDVPDETLPVVDFRTMSGKRKRRGSPEFMDTVNDAVVRQQWYSEHVRLEYRNRPLPFVASFSATDIAETVAKDIRATLRINAELRQECRSWKDFLGKLIQRAEQSGILVMRNGMVGYQRNRKLRVEEFRGFALSDQYAPLIFINYRDAKAAQIFTLAHELAHIWLGASGISNPDPTKTLADFTVDIEHQCNAIAAEVLVPKAEFPWDADSSTEANVQHVAVEYRVSRIVALRRANDLRKIGKDEFTRFAKAEYARSKKADKKDLEREEEGGENFWNWNLFLMKNGHAFTKEVATAARAGRIPFVRAAHLLGVRASTVESYLSKLPSA
ncbi:MAG TPA: ImmA/IrrE family metallo-endopeptidase [Candidatus Angelobacter sp.]